MSRSLSRDTKPITQEKPRPPREAQGERKTRIVRILARANGTTVAEEQAKLDAMMEAGL